MRGFWRRAPRASSLLYLPAALAFSCSSPPAAQDGGLEFNLLDTMLDRLKA